MTTTDWMSQVNRRGVRLESAGDRLRLECPDGALAVDLRPEALERKHEVLALLRQDWYAAASALLSRLAPRLGRHAIEDLRHQFLERAAICELDGGLDRTEAEQTAYAEIAEVAETAGDSS